MQNAKTFTLGNKKLHLLFLTTVGSQLHKLSLSHSDVDLKGVFVWDKTVSAGLVKPQETVEFKNTDKDEWSNLMAQLNEELNLNLQPDDDLTLFEARKFMVTTLKNDFNMFDMLFSEAKHTFNTDLFQNVLDNKEAFLETNLAKERFSGMARGALHEAKKLFKKEVRTKKEANDLLKNQAKSLQFLFSLDNLLKTQTHNPVLPDSQREEVFNVKKGLSDMDSVEKRHLELTEMFETTALNTDLLSKKANKELVNELLVKLTLNV